jgi:type I restriction enzyme S subunit
MSSNEQHCKSEEWIDLRPDEQYRQVTVKMWGQGVVLRNEVAGTEIAATRRMVVRPQQFILSRIDARNGALGLVPHTLDGAIVSNDFPAFNLNTRRILPEFLDWMSKTRSFVELCKAASEGTTNRVRLQEDRLLSLTISLPSPSSATSSRASRGSRLRSPRRAGCGGRRWRGVQTYGEQGHEISSHY